MRLTFSVYLVTVVDFALCTVALTYAHIIMCRVRISRGQTKDKNMADCGCGPDCTCDCHK